MKLIEILCLMATVFTIFVALFGYLLQDSRHAIACSYPENQDKLSCIGYNNSLLPNESYTTPYYDMQEEYENSTILKNYRNEDVEYTTYQQPSSQKENEATTYYKSIEDYTDFKQTYPHLGNNNLSEIHSQINQMNYSENFNQTNPHINSNKEFENQNQATTTHLFKDKGVDYQIKTPYSHHNKKYTPKLYGRVIEFKSIREKFRLESLKFKQAINNLDKNALLKIFINGTEYCDIVNSIIYNGYNFSTIRNFSSTASLYLNENIKLYTFHIIHNVNKSKKLYKFTNLGAKMTEISERDILYALFKLCVTKNDSNRCESFKKNNNLINKNMKNLFDMIIKKGMRPSNFISRIFLDELGEIMQIPSNMILNCTSEFEFSKMNFVSDIEYQKFYDDVNFKFTKAKNYSVIEDSNNFTSRP